MNRIIINFPTNIGDCLLALPVLDRLRTNYPQAALTAICSPKTNDFFLRNTLLDNVIVFNKRWSLEQKMSFIRSYRGQFDMIADLKNSLLPFFLSIPRRTRYIRPFSNKVHIVDKYTNLVEKLAPVDSPPLSDFKLTKDEIQKWQGLSGQTNIAVACSSPSTIKRYAVARLNALISQLPRQCRVLLIGSAVDRDYYASVPRTDQVIDLVGQTKIWEVFHILRHHTRALIGVDSGMTHMAAYLNLPVVALFGPTSFERSYPRSAGSAVLRREELKCVPCESAHCRYNNECMDIDTARVIAAVETILNSD